MGSVGESTYLYQKIDHSAIPIVKEASGIYITLENGQQLIDSTCGAAVSCIGHNDPRIKAAVIKQMEKVTYAHPGYFNSRPAMDLADLLVRTTRGKMARACLAGSGSEAIELTLKLARQYHLELSPKTRRTNFIARHLTWHGCTLGALAVGDFKARRTIYNELLSTNVSRVSECHPYRRLLQGETEQEYVQRLKEELDAEFQRVGPDTVAAFVLEPMVGTVLGCVPPVPGYLKAMKEVCEKYGALIIFDEVMVGVGRTGTFHAWEQEDVVPDILALGKGLGAGYSPISAVLVHQGVVDVLKYGSGTFEHGQTYQAHTLSCATALAVQKVIQQDGLIEQARTNGDYLGRILKETFSHRPYVGDVRGRGLFWCIEFVADKRSKEPFDPVLNVARRIRMRGLERGYDVCLFSSSGCADGDRGDHFMLAPPFIATQGELAEIVLRAGRVVDSIFAEVEVEQAKLQQHLGMNGLH